MHREIFMISSEEGLAVLSYYGLISTFKLFRGTGETYPRFVDGTKFSR